MENKEKIIKFRTDTKTHARLTMLAKIYAKGNLSAWMTWAGMEAPRKYLFGRDKAKAKKKKAK